MNKALIGLIALGLAGSAGVASADDDSDADVAIASSELDTENLEMELEAARERLDEAAHEVAELSAQIGKPVMDHFMAFGDGPRRAIIGVQLDPTSGKEGARVKEVSPGGPAAEAGIQAKDVIVMVNGTQVKGDSAREVTRLMRKVEPDSDVKVRVLRDGKQKDFIVIARPAEFATFTAPAPPMPPLPPGVAMSGGHGPFVQNFDAGTPFFRAFGGDYADMELASLTPQLGSYFGTSEGVLVVRAPKEAGLKLEDGDVILSIDGRKPSSGSHATRILRSYQPGEKVSMKVMRQKKAVNLDVTLPERKGGFPGNRVYRTEEPS